MGRDRAGMVCHGPRGDESTGSFRVWGSWNPCTREVGGTRGHCGAGPEGVGGAEGRSAVEPGDSGFHLFSSDSLCNPARVLHAPCCLSFLIYETGIRISSSMSQGHCVKIGQVCARHWDRLGGGWQSCRCHWSLLSVKTAITTATMAGIAKAKKTRLLIVQIQ